MDILIEHYINIQIICRTTYLVALLSGSRFNKGILLPTDKLYIDRLHHWAQI